MAVGSPIERPHGEKAKDGELCLGTPCEVDDDDRRSGRRAVPSGRSVSAWKGEIRHPLTVR